MSFVCDFCGQPQPNGVKPKKIIVNKVIYELNPFDEDDTETGLLVVKSHQKTNIGSKEVKACPACAAELKSTEITEVVNGEDLICAKK